MHFRKNFRAFTLVELMIVIAIIGILAAVLYPMISGYFERARDAKKKSEIQKIMLALTLYSYDNGSFRVKGYGNIYNWHADGSYTRLPEWRGDGWFNYTSDQYPKSIAEWLEKQWYLRGVEIIPLSKRKDIKNKEKHCAKSENVIRGTNLYLFRISPDGNKYMLSTFLETSATTADYDYLKNLWDGNSVCTWAGHNYAVGDE